MTVKWKLNDPSQYSFSNKPAPYKKVCIGIRGQHGDVIMQEPALRKFIKDNPDTKIVLAVSKPFENILPLFKNYHDNIVEFKVFEGYDDWPTEGDVEYINEQNFDAMFPPDIPRHEQNDWAKYRHITTETALMIGLDSDTINVELNLPEDVVKEPNTVSLHLFSSKWPGGARSISVDKQTKIVKYLTGKGYKVYQLSAPHQPHIEGAIFGEGTYYDACIKMLSTDLLITCDSGMPWVASAYDHPMLGLYSAAYNPLVGTTKNWQPVNPHAVYLEAQLAEEISWERIKEEIDKKLGKES